MDGAATGTRADPAVFLFDIDRPGDRGGVSRYDTLQQSSYLR